MHCMKAIPISILRVFAPAMPDACMRIAPLCQAVINRVCTRVHRAQGNRHSDQRLAGPWLNVVQHAENHLSTALDHSEDQGLLRCEGATAGGGDEGLYRYHDVSIVY